jgi:hypothetical protein
MPYNINMSGRWNAPKVVNVAKKLGNKSNGWNLANASSLSSSGRSSNEDRVTRNGGDGRPNLRKRVFNEPSTSDSDDGSSFGSSDCVVSDTDLEEEDLVSDVGRLEEEDEDSKPPSSRIILEVSGLTETLKQNCRCADCFGPVNVSIKTVCVASRIILKCSNSECAFVYNMPLPAAASIDDNSDHVREKITDSAVNISYVLGLVACGDGGAEAARILGLLGLPNDTTTFPTARGVIMHLFYQYL